MAKWLGTLAPTIQIGILGAEIDVFILGFGMLCSVLDLIYLALLITEGSIRASTADRPATREGSGFPGPVDLP